MRGNELVINCSDGVAALVQFTRTGRTREIARRAAFVLPEGLDASGLAAHLAGLADETGMRCPWSGVILDGEGVLVREFTYPFNAPAKVERAVRFEMQGGLPCPAEDLEGGVLVHRRGKGCRVFSFSLRRERLASMVRAFEETDLDPDLVGVDLAALASFAQRLPEAEEPSWLVDVGFGRTLLALVGPGGVLGLARRACGVGVAVDAGSCSRQDVLDGRAQDGALDGAHLTEAVAELERAARQLALSCSVEPSRFLLCGAGAQAPGLAQALADRAGAPVVPVWNVADPAAYGLAEAADPLAAGALGEGGVLGAGRTGTVNLRRGEFARSTDPRGLAKRYAWAGAMAALLLVSWGAFQMAQGMEGRRALKAAEAEIESVFHEAAPDARGDFSRTQMFSILKTRIGRLKGSRDQGKERAATKAIEVLRAVNDAAPADLDVVLDALAVGPDSGRITGTAGDFQAVNALLEQVAAGGKLADARIVVASAVQKTGRVRFELEYARK